MGHRMGERVPSTLLSRPVDFTDEISVTKSHAEKPAFLAGQVFSGTSLCAILCGGGIRTMRTTTVMNLPKTTPVFRSNILNAANHAQLQSIGRFVLPQSNFPRRSRKVYLEDS